MDNRPTETAATLDAFAEAVRLPLHQYEFLFEMTTQLLAAQRLEEQMSLVLDTVTTGLGYSQAAIALIDKHQGLLKMRMAAGFADDAAVGSLELPLDSNAPQVRVVHDGRPAWVERADEGGEAGGFLEQLGGQSD